MKEQKENLQKTKNKKEIVSITFWVKSPIFRNNTCSPQRKAPCVNSTWRQLGQASASQSDQQIQS